MGSNCAIAAGKDAAKITVSKFNYTAEKQYQQVLDGLEEIRKRCPKNMEGAVAEVKSLVQNNPKKYNHVYCQYEKNKTNASYALCLRGKLGQNFYTTDGNWKDHATNYKIGDGLSSDFHKNNTNSAYSAGKNQEAISNSWYKYSDL